MSREADEDAPRSGSEATAPGFSDALTYAFGDPRTGVCGVARLGLSEGTASGLALIFRDGRPVAVRADGGIPVAAPAWEAVGAAGLSTTTEDAGAAWTVSYAGDDEPFSLSFEATSPPLVLEADAAAARAGGMSGADRVCRVAGTIGGQPFEGLGQRGRSWGAPDWERMALARTVAAWTGPEHAVSLVAIRPAKAKTHADEELSAHVFDGDREEETVRPVADARLSTIYDGDGRQRRAGLELYVGADDAYARRLAGEVVAGTSLDLGRLRLDCAFFRWRMEGREGIGHYDVLRRAS